MKNSSVRVLANGRQIQPNRTFKLLIFDQKIGCFLNDFSAPDNSFCANSI